MTRSKAKLPAFGPLLAAVAIPLLLPLLQQPPPSLAYENQTIETEGPATTNSYELMTSTFQETDVSDGHQTSTASEQETSALPTSTVAITQSQFHKFTSESTASTITVKYEPTTNTAAPAVTSTLELPSNATTVVEITTNDWTHDSTETSRADVESTFSSQLSTSSPGEISSEVEETIVTLEITDITETTTVMTVSTQSSRADDQTNSQTTWSAQSHSQATTVSSASVHTSAESQLTKEETSTHTEALSRPASGSPSAAGWTTPGDSNETQRSSTEQSIASQELPIGTSDGNATTAFPRRRLIHAVATYGVDYKNVTAANFTELFKESFTTALTILLKIDRADIIILKLESGSIRVHFEINVLSGGVEQVASDLKNKTDELHTAFISSVQNYSTALSELLGAAGKPNITVHVMPEASSAPVSEPAPTTAAPKTSDAPAASKSLTDGEIVGVVIGSVLGGLLLVAIVACICKKRSSGTKLDEIASGGFKARSIANYEMVAGPGA